jgi:hypothetical protein
MNLKEILDYRNNCLICNRPLKFKIRKYPKLSISQTDEGLKIQSENKNGVYLLLKYDGTYDRNKRNYKIYSNPIFIDRTCPHHMRGEPDTVVTAYRGGVGNAVDTSLGNLRELAYSYQFTVLGDANKNYDAHLHQEIAHYYDHESFWHINTRFYAKMSSVFHAEWGQKLSAILHLNLPSIDLKNIRNVEQMISKVKLYTLFS